MKNRNAASYRRVDSLSVAPAIRRRAKKRRSSTPSIPFKALAEIGRLRAEAEAEIDRLIAFLDRTDVDCDLEENGDHEPNLGTGGMGGDRLDEVEEDHADDEPTLGWTQTACQFIPNTSVAGCDLELGQFVEKPKQVRRKDQQHITVENSYRRFVEGITPPQKALMKPRLDRDSWVVLR